MGNLQIGYLRNPEGTDCKPVILSGEDRDFYEQRRCSFFPENNFTPAKKFVTKQEYQNQTRLEDFLRENPEMGNDVIEINEDVEGQIVDVVIKSDATNKAVQTIGNTVAGQYQSGWSINLYSGEISPNTFKGSFFYRSPRPAGPKPFHPKQNGASKPMFR